MTVPIAEQIACVERELRMRARHDRLIGTATCCWVSPISLEFTARCVTIPERFPGVGEQRRDIDTIDAFARSEGFPDWETLSAYWRDIHGAAESYIGVIIGWDDTFRAVTIQGGTL